MKTNINFEFVGSPNISFGEKGIKKFLDNLEVGKLVRSNFIAKSLKMNEGTTRSICKNLTDYTIVVSKNRWLGNRTTIKEYIKKYGE